jgi:hypothetical protein
VKIYRVFELKRRNIRKALGPYSFGRRMAGPLTYTTLSSAYPPFGRLFYAQAKFTTALRSASVRMWREAEVQGLQKRGAQHVRIKGQAVDLSPTDASASWGEDWRVVSTRFNFLLGLASTRRLSSTVLLVSQQNARAKWPSTATRLASGSAFRALATALAAPGYFTDPGRTSAGPRLLNRNACRPRGR